MRQDDLWHLIAGSLNSKALLQIQPVTMCGEAIRRRKGHEHPILAFDPFGPRGGDLVCGECLSIRPVDCPILSTLIRPRLTRPSSCTSTGAGPGHQ